MMTASIRKITSKSIRLQQKNRFKNRFEVSNKDIFSSVKMRNSGNFICNYAHSFSGEDFI